jgi:hypothetical protein
MTKPEYLSRFAIGADVPKVGTLVDAAYGHYVEHLGILPHPMTDAHAPVIVNQRVTVAESHGAPVVNGRAYELAVAAQKEATRPSTPSSRGRNGSGNTTA